MSHTRKIRDEEFNQLLAQLVNAVKAAEKSHKSLLKKSSTLASAMHMITREDGLGVLAETNTVEFIANGYLARLNNQIAELKDADRSKLTDISKLILALQEKVKSLEIEPVIAPQFIETPAAAPTIPRIQIDAEDLHDARKAESSKLDQIKKPPRPETPLPSRKTQTTPSPEQPPAAVTAKPPRPETPLPPRKAQTTPSPEQRPAAVETKPPRPETPYPPRKAHSTPMPGQNPVTPPVTRATGTPRPGRKPPAPPAGGLFSDSKSRTPTTSSKPEMTPKKK